MSPHDIIESNARLTRELGPVWPRGLHCDPIEALDAVNECSHGALPHEGCEHGCFGPDSPEKNRHWAELAQRDRAALQSEAVTDTTVSPLDELHRRQVRAQQAAAGFTDMVAPVSAPAELSAEVVAAFRETVRQQGLELTNRLVAGKRLTSKQRRQLKALRAIDDAFGELDVKALLVSKK